MSMRPKGDRAALKAAKKPKTGLSALGKKPPKKEVAKAEEDDSVSI